LTKYDEDGMRRPHGARHPLAGLPQKLLDAAAAGLAPMANMVGIENAEDSDSAIEVILIALRAGGHLSVSPLFVASVYAYESNDGNTEPTRGSVLDLHDWPHSEDITEMLFGTASIPWDKAVWAAENLNTDYAIGPEAWAKHQEKIKEGAQ